MLQPWMIPADLTPGDARSLERDWSDVELHVIKSTEDPAFSIAFEALWNEFGPRGEMESREVLARRFARDGRIFEKGYALAYELLLVTAGGKFAAVHDHTVIIPQNQSAASVFLSHILVAPEWRRSGLTGWMRALPLQAARSALVKRDAPITLIGEMEYPDRDNPATLIRLKAYEKAGYLKLDPKTVSYWQPDFRSPEEIDRNGGPQPLPLTLLVRRIGREEEPRISALEARELIAAIYHMYLASFREQDMAALFASLENHPVGDVALIPPTADIPEL